MFLYYLDLLVITKIKLKNPVINTDHINPSKGMRYIVSINAPVAAPSRSKPYVLEAILP